MATQDGTMMSKEENRQSLSATPTSEKSASLPEPLTSVWDEDLIIPPEEGLALGARINQERRSRRSE